MEAQRALITGGTSGIGRQLVVAAARKGYEVTFVGRDRDCGLQLQESLRSSYPNPFSDFVCLDLESASDVQQFAREYLKRGPPPTLLANIAGSLIPRPTEGAQQIDKSLAVSCLAALQLSQELIPSMRHVQGARIVNVGASPGVVLRQRIDLQELEHSGKLTTAGGSQRSYSPFVASALAVHAKVVLTQCLAEQLSGSTVTINAFHPGMVRSGLFRGLSGPSRWAMRIAQPLMKKESTSALRAAFDPELHDTSGALIVGMNKIALEFESKYRERLWDIAEGLLRRSLLVK